MQKTIPPLRRVLLAAAALAAALAGTALLATGSGLALAAHKAERRLDVTVAPLELPSGEAALARGRYLFESRGCADCHGESGGGRVFVDEGGVHLAGPDITRSGSTAAYQPQDWVRAVRHGVAPDGRPLRVMPSEDYNRLTDADLGALVAHVRRLPPQQGRPARIELPLPARVLYGFGLLDDAADRIDHRLPPQSAVPEGATVEHGRYVAQMCTGCHGAGFSGGRIPGAPPEWPAAANLTPGEGGAMAAYADADAFARMMRSGLRADGSRIAVMPFEALAKMNDIDLEAMRQFLATLPAREAGLR